MRITCYVQRPSEVLESTPFHELYMHTYLLTVVIGVQVDILILFLFINFNVQCKPAMNPVMKY